MTSQRIELNSIVPASHTGKRADQSLALLFPQYSRAKLSQWLKEQFITFDGIYLLPKQLVKGGEHIVMNIQLENVDENKPQAIPLTICFEDAHLMVIDKPTNLVVHPGAGNPDGTLVNALLHYLPALSHLPRAGIIHRLDKDTTGLLVIAKTLETHATLVKLMQQRDIKRHYLALVYGELLDRGIVNSPIGRSHANRTKMALRPDGKPAVTYYKLKQAFEGFTLLDVQLDTGRTHQIRVHMQSLNHSLVGDTTYRGSRHSKEHSPAILAAIKRLGRQALHAYQLSLPHPVTGETITLSSPLPEDFLQVLTALEQEVAHGTSD